MKFTSEQKKILGHNPEKHACILAGPGTGRSSTIISYISEFCKNESKNQKIKELIEK